jgi:hypothetical protein
MFRWICVTVLLSAAAVAAVWMTVPHVIPAAQNPPASAGDAPEKKKPVAPRQEEAPPSPRQSSASTAMPGQPNIYVYRKDVAQVLTEPVLIPDCPLKIVEKQEVACEKEGVLKFIGTDLQMGEEVPPHKQLPEAQLGFLAIRVGDQPVEGEKCFQVRNFSGWYREARPNETLEATKVFLFHRNQPVRKLQVGDKVKRGQLLAQVNPAKSSDDVSVKIAKLDGVEFARRLADNQKREYKRRYDNYLATNRSQPGAIPTDQLMETRLQWVKAESEEDVKKAEIVEAQRTLNAAVTDLKMHEVRAAIDGVVMDIYKNHQGDAVKPFEALLRIENPTRLRADGRLPIEEALKLSEGMTAIIEASLSDAPRLVLTGHLGPVNCVAVSKGKRPVIVSGSDDETLRGWDSVTGEKLWTIWPLRSPVKAVACTPPSCTKYNLACFGCADGTVRLIDLDNPDKQNLRETSQRHNRAVLGVAFSPDGEVVATCGDDSLIRLWKTETGDLLCTVPGHAGPVTSVQFASAGRLVSAGKDARLIVWDVEDASRTRQVGPRFDHRGGQVHKLGVSPDGKTVMFDQGKELRLLNLENKETVGTLHNPSGQMNFSTMALFSPDGKTILTNRSGSSPEKLQLWRTPGTQTRRGSELRQFIWKGAATCGAFAPNPDDCSFAVTGTEDHKVLVWSMPGKAEIESHLEAKLTLVEKYIDTQNRDVRVWAELQAPEWLIPGMKATMVVLPPRK